MPRSLYLNVVCNEENGDAMSPLLEFVPARVHVGEHQCETSDGSGIRKGKDRREVQCGTEVLQT